MVRSKKKSTLTATWKKKNQEQKQQDFPTRILQESSVGLFSVLTTYIQGLHGQRVALLGLHCFALVGPQAPQAEEQSQPVESQRDGSEESEGPPHAQGLCKPPRHQAPQSFACTDRMAGFYDLTSPLALKYYITANLLWSHEGRKGSPADPIEVHHSYRDEPSRHTSYNARPLGQKVARLPFSKFLVSTVYHQTTDIIIDRSTSFAVQKSPKLQS